MGVFRHTAFAILFCLLGGTAQANDDIVLSGTPVLLAGGIIMVQGHEITLWGIDMLARDQECWHDNRAWDCGEQAMMTLRHRLAGNPVHCTVMSDDADGKITAQCFNQINGEENDIARYLVAEGWARDQSDATDGFYAEDEEFARGSRRGIWTSRFQSAEDWKNGVQRYVEYEMAPQKTLAAAPALPPSSDTNNKPQ